MYEEDRKNLEKRSVRLYHRIFTFLEGIKKSEDNSDRKIVLYLECKCVFLICVLNEYQTEEGAQHHEKSHH